MNLSYPINKFSVGFLILLLIIYPGSVKYTSVIQPRLYIKLIKLIKHHDIIIKHLYKCFILPFQVVNIIETLQDIIYSFSFTCKKPPSIYKFGLSVCLSVCLFVCLCNKRQNGWTDQAQILCRTSRDHREGLWMIKILKICV